LNGRLIIISIVALMVCIVVPVEAYTPYVHDSNWHVFTKGDDVVKPGTTVDYTIWGTFNVGSQTKPELVVSVWVYQPSRWSRIRSYDILRKREYSGENTFNETFTVSIPNDAVQNTPVYIDLETSTTCWGWLTLSIVQDPDYEQLNNEYNEYKQTYSRSDSEYSSLNSIYNDVSEVSFVLITIMAVLLFTAIYFAVRKRKVKVSAP